MNRAKASLADVLAATGATTGAIAVITLAVSLLAVSLLSRCDHEPPESPVPVQVELCRETCEVSRLRLDGVTIAPDGGLTCRCRADR